MSSKGKPTGEYDVGYGKPPVHSRFRPGQSGNRNGRPKGSRNRLPPEFENYMRTIIDDEANRMITVQDAQGKKREITTKRAVMRSIAVNALKGHQRSQQLFTDLIGQSERVEQRERQETFERWFKYKNVWTQEFARYKSLRRGEPDQLPHPDHVVLDLETGRVDIAGPATKEEKVSWDRWKKIRGAISKELNELLALRGGSDDEGTLMAIAIVEETLTIIDLALGGSRAVMKFLEKSNVPNIEEALQPTKKRRHTRIISMTAEVYAAIRKEYLNQTS